MSWKLPQSSVSLPYLDALSYLDSKNNCTYIPSRQLSTHLKRGSILGPQPFILWVQPRRYTFQPTGYSFHVYIWLELPGRVSFHHTKRNFPDICRGKFDSIFSRYVRRFKSFDVHFLKENNQFFLSGAFSLIFFS